MADDSMKWRHAGSWRQTHQLSQGDVGWSRAESTPSADNHRIRSGHMGQPAKWGHGAHGTHDSACRRTLGRRIHEIESVQADRGLGRQIIA